jgi:hypothetical protein
MIRDRQTEATRCLGIAHPIVQGGPLRRRALHAPTRLDIAPEEFARVTRIFAPYFRELDLPPPAAPPRFHPSFDAEVEALLPSPRRARSQLKAARPELRSLWASQIAPNLRHRDASELMNSLLSRGIQTMKL